MKPKDKVGSSLWQQTVCFLYAKDGAWLSRMNSRSLFPALYSHLPLLLLLTPSEQAGCNLGMCSFLGRGWSLFCLPFLQEGVWPMSSVTAVPFNVLLLLIPGGAGLASVGGWDTAGFPIRKRVVEEDGSMGDE